jgi:hypothetical protein
MVAAAALSISRVADLTEIGLSPAAAATIALHFGNADVDGTVGPELELELDPELELELLEPEQELKLDDEPEPEVPSGPMAGFDQAAVLAWVGTVAGLTAAQRTAAVSMMAEDEYDGSDLSRATAKHLRRLLKGSNGEEAVPLLLAARDARLALEEAAAAAASAPAAAAELLACIVCLEPYSAVGGVVPRMLHCGHDFCEVCLDRMLAPEPPARRRRKRLECPTCRQECGIRSGRAAELPIVYALQGA